MGNQGSHGKGMGVGSTLRHIQKSNATADGVDEEGTH